MATVQIEVHINNSLRRTPSQLTLEFARNATPAQVINSVLAATQPIGM